MSYRLFASAATSFTCLSRHQISRGVSTMPSKRKRTDAEIDIAKNPRPPEALRRSSRRTKDGDSSVTNSVKVAKEGVLSPVADANKNGLSVQDAMQELSAMEIKLQRDVRRQRLAVETSDLNMESAAKAELGPRYHLSAKDTVVSRPALKTAQKEEIYKQTIKQGCEQTSPSNQGADAAFDDLVEDALDNGFDRAANRPPAVDSDVLPLPWSGRLGYVSNTNLCAPRIH